MEMIRVVLCLKMLHFGCTKQVLQDLNNFGEIVAAFEVLSLLMLPTPH